MFKKLIRALTGRKESERGTQENRVYVGNLPYRLRRSELREAFSVYGEVLGADIVIDRRTRRSKGFGFVTFANAKDAQKALNMNGKELNGRTLRVNLAQEKAEKEKSYS